MSPDAHELRVRLVTKVLYDNRYRMLRYGPEDAPPAMFENVADAVLTAIGEWHPTREVPA